VRRTLELVDIVRIDHFRGFADYWEIPAAEPTAVHGRWLPGPGMALFDAIHDALGPLPLIAEDLGVITPAVEALRDRFALPGMKILQFAFDGNDDNAYLPANYKGSRWVVYTGTHDNATSLGWWRDLDDDARGRVAAVVGGEVRAPSWQLLEVALAAIEEAGVERPDQRVEALEIEDVRRTSLACALIGAPDLLVLDDPWEFIETQLAVRRAMARGAAVLAASSDPGGLPALLGASIHLSEGAPG
jgi:4-alpha-glucanotransferase